MDKQGRLTKNTFCNGPEIISASGLYLTTKQGQKLLDFSSQTLNLNFGQRPPAVLRAIREYADLSPMFLSSRFQNPEFNALADLLVQVGPKGLSVVNLKLSNGSDANESAIKRVRTFRKKLYVVSYRYSHLGESSETIQASESVFSKKYIGGSGNFIFIDPQSLTCKHTLDKTCSVLCLDHICRLFQSRRDIAGIILEPIMVNAGVYAFTPSYLTLLRELCDRFNISLIFDEVQTAFGWTGWNFVSEMVGVTPDLLTLGKGLSAGFPLAGVLMKPEYDVLDYGMDEFTYGGHVLSIKVALQMLQYSLKHKVLQRVRSIVPYFEKSLRDLQKKHCQIINIRAYGLIVGIEFATNTIACSIYDRCLVKGLILRRTKDNQGESLVLKPALIVAKKDIDQAVKILDSVLSEFP